ncbi:MAG TPA: SDR family NAD(P)-dependent oxidoreductase, partial [Candidatus Angelobacter sp.]|nr:SDR family NAD(P)-dependent oxidoreductase [Candidatus Angelobacter sp.]
MKQELRQIYDNLAKGTLSQKQALEKVKAIKLQEQSRKSGALLAIPVWQDSGAESSAETGSFAEHHIILCELPKIDLERLRSLLPQSRCLSLHGEEQKNIAQRYSEHSLECFERIKAILQSKPLGKVLVHIVVAIQHERALLSGLSGLLKTAALENPQLIGHLMLAESKLTAEELARHLAAEKARGPELLSKDSFIRYVQGVRQVLRWQEIAVNPEKTPSAFKEQGVYLITGGLGGLGVLFVKEILTQTRTAKVILTGRSALNAKKKALLDELSAPPGRVSYQQVDLGDLDQVRQLIANIKDEHRQLNGIVHCAGMIADSFILKKASAQFSEVLAPKVAGAYNLDQASQDVELDFFVLFSSIAGAMGHVGQVDYAAANGFLDQFAAYRNQQVAGKRRRGLTRSINWPLWQTGGMEMDAASQQLLEQTTGLQPMETATGIEMLYRSLALPYDQLLVMEGELAKMRRALLAGRPIPPEPSTLAATVEQTRAAMPEKTEKAKSGMDSHHLVERVQEYLCREFSELLKLPADNIDPQAALEKYGIDSILAMKLTAQLEKTFGALSKTLFFEYQTIQQLTGYFIAQHSAQLTALVASTETATSQSATIPLTTQAESPIAAKLVSGRRSRRLRDNGPGTESEPIAIVGLSGRYPEAANIEAYWHNLREGRDCIVEVPRERWDWREYFSEDRSNNGHHYSKWGGFIAGVDEFDPLFFNIAPKEAKYIDPQERLFLQHAWMAIEDAGYTRSSLQTADERDLAGQVGVYVGVMYTEYQLFAAEAGVKGKRMGIAGSMASIANRVSYALNLHGPSMTLDTMCSSSLTAIHLACQDLKQGRTSMAIAGGVNVSVHPNKYLMLSAGQFISGDGHCQSFGEGGDGYIPGEGVGVVVLKRLADARRDGDHIYGIIRGSALNHGGKTNGYTVPNPQAQTTAISRALAESHIDARHISYVEAHGTGTRLGDPIEIAALSKAFQQHTQDTGYCLIGSVKSNVGHCESAAGIAGLTKVLLQMQHQQIVPSLHSEQLNPHIDFDKSPFVVNQKLTGWQQPEIEGRKLPRIAGISSFGAGGSNAHMIVEEYPAAAPTQMALGNVIILLSARTAEQLKEKARDLLDFIRAKQQTIDLGSMAYTLQVGREAMEQRLGFLVNSIEQLAENLQAYVAGEQNIKDSSQGQAKRGEDGLSLFRNDVDLQQTVDKWLTGRKLFKLLELWAKGVEVDWGKLYGETKPPRMSLPAYPFARERYWVELPAGTQVATTVIHPLLHRNTSDLKEQRYSSTFTGEEFFFVDHPLKPNGMAGPKVLSAVAYLEMARAAIKQSLPSRELSVLELRNVVWAQPVGAGGIKQIGIALWAKNNNEISYEIYSQDTEEEIVHCQGHAVWTQPSASATLDLARLKEEMRQGQVEVERVYAECGRMGLVHEHSVRTITAVYQGDNQLLARLQLPGMAAGEAKTYVLHPGLIGGALQAAGALLGVWSESSCGARLLAALDSLSIISPCSQEMFLWARHAPGSPASDQTTRLDIDLCDEQGNICVQMRGVSWHAASQEFEASSAIAQPANLQPAVSDILPAITAALKTLLANELQMRESDIGENVQFVDLGLDSITGVTWVRKINEKYQAFIEAIKLYSYPTLTQLSRYVKEEAEKHGTLPRQDASVAASATLASRNGTVQPKAAKLSSGRGSSSRPARNSSDSIAVIGMAGQFPQAKNVEEFWRNIAQGRNCITQVPSERWDVNAYYHPDKAVAGKTNGKWLGALEGYNQFDPLFFSISPKEAASMDPQQRLLLQACWHTIENAGYDARSLSGVKCGVFMGCTHGDYHLLSREQQLSAQGFTGDATSILAGRISYFLDLQGPCLSIDTACSSSLVAIASACESLVSGGSDLALAGGVYVMAGPEMHIKTAQAGMLSPEGKCFTFDQRADGFVPGEGVGVVMLKRLADAQRDQDTIYGVIEGWGVNQDGKTNGITAPNLESQTRLEQEVYEKYRIDPSGIQLIEAHGTGTKLGDPIEVEGLKKAFKKYTTNQKHCALGSVKSNIGHCLTAAGIAGFIKLLLALQHKQLPPTINFDRLNEHIDLEASPFYVNSRLQEWELNGAERRRAAINALGFSGTNAHIVVGEYLPPAEFHSSTLVMPPDTNVIILLSARTAEQLKEKARDLLDYIRPRVKAIDLVSVAYTLQVGREAMEERVGLVAGSAEQLVEKLEAFVAGKRESDDVYRGQVKGNKELLSLFSSDADLQQAVEKWISGRKVTKLLELWVKGLEVEWSKLYGERRPRRMSLPGYPFARERYWIETGGAGRHASAHGAGANTATTAAAVLHPLVHSNTSDLKEQSYSATFSGEEFFVKDHQVEGH